MQTIKHAYASTMQGLGSGLYSSGVLNRETPPRRGDLTRWLHSLFAISDIEAMIRLDLPSWTLRAAKLVDRFLQHRPGATVFEYGAGASTVFLAKRAEIVISAEHDPQWHAVVTQKVAAHPNVLLTLAEAEAADSQSGHWSADAAWAGYDFQNYVQAIDRFAGLFDLIVVDGRCRAHCLQAAKRRLKPDGLILFGNGGRRRYRAALEGSAMPKLSTSGLTACLPYPNPTVLLSPDAGLLQSLVDPASAEAAPSDQAPSDPVQVDPA